MKRYHRVFAEININHIIDNLTEIRAHVGSHTKVMLVIKADGYGHGAIPIAKALNDEDIDYIGVATIHEAVSLRKEGVGLPILILSYTPVDLYETLINFNLTQTVYQMETVHELSEMAVRLGQKAKVHIKVDTGMNRIGFKPTDASLEHIDAISKMAGIEIEGLFTHFSKADEGETAFTDNQIKRFDAFVKQVKALGIHPPLVHYGNSAGMIDFKQAHGDLVRVGIALYGLYPSDMVDHNIVTLKPSLTLKSHVIHVKYIEPGDKVSYGGRYTAQERRRIATIPVGYGDGYPRALSCQGRVLINGQYAPIVGNVCMDQFMVDVTDIQCEFNDPVTLIGVDGDHEITVEEIAAFRDTIPYEIICQLGKRIPRVYIRDDEIIQMVDYF